MIYKIKLKKNTTIYDILQFSCNSTKKSGSSSSCTQRAPNRLSSWRAGGAPIYVFIDSLCVIDFVRICVLICFVFVCLYIGKWKWESHTKYSLPFRL